MSEQPGWRTMFVRVGADEVVGTESERVLVPTGSTLRVDTRWWRVDTTVTILRDKLVIVEVASVGRDRAQALDQFVQGITERR